MKMKDNVKKGGGQLVPPPPSQFYLPAFELIFSADENVGQLAHIFKLVLFFKKFQFLVVKKSQKIQHSFKYYRMYDFCHILYFLQISIR